MHFKSKLYLFSNTQAIFARTAHEAGCSYAHDIMDCLRHTHVETLQKSNLDISHSGFMGEFQFVPVVDGKFIQQSPVAAISKRALNGKVYLGVTNTNEGDTFVNVRKL